MDLNIGERCKVLQRTSNARQTLKKCRCNIKLELGIKNCNMKSKLISNGCIPLSWSSGTNVVKFFYISKKKKLLKKGKRDRHRKKIHSPFHRIQITKIENLNAVKPHLWLIWSLISISSAMEGTSFTTNSYRNKTLYIFFSFEK